MREHGGEYGTVTGRDRRCGWLDLVGLRFAARVNGLTELAVTKLDVLSIFDSIPVCTGYRLPDGTVTDDFPGHQSDFHHAQPRVRGAARAGTSTSPASATYAELPAAARDYLAFVEERVGVPVAIVGIGQRRDQIITGGCKPSPDLLAAVGPCVALCFPRSGRGSVFARRGGLQTVAWPCRFGRPVRGWRSKSVTFRRVSVQPLRKRYSGDSGRIHVARSLAPCRLAVIVPGHSRR